SEALLRREVEDGRALEHGPDVGPQLVLVDQSLRHGLLTAGQGDQASYADELPAPDGALDAGVNLRDSLCDSHLFPQPPWFPTSSLQGGSATARRRLPARTE